MAANRRRPREDDDEDDATPYGLAFEPPHVAPPIPLPPPDEEDEVTEPANAPRRKKKPKRSAAEETAAAAKLGGATYFDRILDRVEAPPTAYPWWVEVAAAGVAGALLILVGIAAVAIRADKAGVDVGVVLVAGALTVILAHSAFMAFTLMVVGQVMTVDYGPVVQTVPKLAAATLLANGLTLALVGVGLPCALLFSAMIFYTVFQRLFRLSMMETIYCVVALMMASWVLNFGLSMAARMMK